MTKLSSAAASPPLVKEKNLIQGRQNANLAWRVSKVLFMNCPSSQMWSSFNSSSYVQCGSVAWTQEHQENLVKILPYFTYTLARTVYQLRFLHQLRSGSDHEKMEEQPTSTPVSLRGFKFKVRNQFPCQNGDFAWVIFAIKFPVRRSSLIITRLYCHSDVN